MDWVGGSGDVVAVEYVLDGFFGGLDGGSLRPQPVTEAVPTFIFVEARRRPYCGHLFHRYDGEVSRMARPSSYHQGPCQTE